MSENDEMKEKICKKQIIIYDDDELDIRALRASKEERRVILCAVALGRNAHRALERTLDEATRRTFERSVLHQIYKPYTLATTDTSQNATETLTSILQNIPHNPLHRQDRELPHTRQFLLLLPILVPPRSRPGAEVRRRRARW